MCYELENSAQIQNQGNKSGLLKNYLVSVVVFLQLINCSIMK